MKKDLLAKAVRLAHKTTVKPHKVVIAAPKQIKAAAPEMMSERLYLRVTPSQMQALLRHVPKGSHISELLRNLLVDFLTKTAHAKTRTKT